MADQFGEWDRFIEAYEDSPTAEVAMVKYQRQRSKEGTLKGWQKQRHLGNLRRIAKRKAAEAHLVAAGIVLSKDT